MTFRSTRSRVRREHLPELLRALRIPDVVVVRRTRMSGMEVLFLSLVRYHRPVTWTDVHVQMRSRVCERTYSHAFHWFAQHVYKNSKQCVSDITRWHLWVSACSRQIAVPGAPDYAYSSLTVPPVGAPCPTAALRSCR